MRTDIKQMKCGGCGGELFKIYTSDELEPKAQERARQWLRELTASDFGDVHADHSLDEFATICGGLGIDIDTKTRMGFKGKQYAERSIYWALGYTQSDGAGFEGTLRVRDIALSKVMDYLPAEPKDDDEANQNLRTAVGIAASMVLAFPAARAEYDSSGCGINVKSADAFYWHNDDMPDDATVEAMNDTFESQADDLGGHLSAYLYERLRDEHEYQSSDEALEETIRANGYEFDADGERV